MLRGEPVIRKVVDEPAPENRRASVPTAGPAGTAADAAGQVGWAPATGWSGA